MLHIFPVYYMNVVVKNAENATKKEKEMPHPDDYSAAKLKEAFDKARAQDVNPDILFFVPAIEHILASLNGQKGMHARLVSYTFSTRRDAPYESDYTAFKNVDKCRVLKEVSICDTRCLRVDFDITHDFLGQVKALDARLDVNTTSIPFTVCLFDNGHSEIRWLDRLDRYTNPDNALDPFSVKSDAQIIDTVSKRLADCISKDIRITKEKNALGVTQERKTPVQPKQIVTMK